MAGVLLWKSIAALVLGAAVRLLMNPTVLQLGVLLLVAMGAFIVGAVAIRHLRKDLTREADSLTQAPVSIEGLPVHSYHAVIQQLKQQKHELAAQQLAERR